MQWGTEGEKGCKGAHRLQSGRGGEEWRVYRSAVGERAQGGQVAEWCRW